MTTTPRARVRAPRASQTQSARRVGRRAPFVLLVLVLLSGGLIALLMLNTALNQGSFELTRLQKQTSQYTDEQQSLQQQIDQWSAPGALAARARQLGMVPGGDPAFLDPSGRVLGEAKRVADVVPPLAGPTPGSAPAPMSTPTPSPSPASAPSPSPAPAAGTTPGPAVKPASAAPSASAAPKSAVPSAHSGSKH